MADCKAICLKLGMLIFFLMVMLGVLYFLMSQLPEQRIRMSSTDIQVANDVSTVWCRKQFVVSDHLMDTYRIDKKPEIDQEVYHSHNVNYSIHMTWKKQKVLRYYMLSGSKLHIKACSSNPDAYVYVTKGHRNLIRCLRRTTSKFFDNEDDDDSFRDSEDRFKNDFDFSEIIEKFQKWERIKKVLPVYLRRCQDAEASRQIPTRCNEKSISVNIEKSDVYYVIVKNFHRKSINQINLSVTLKRTSYKVDQSNTVCTKSSQCDVTLSFASSNRVMLYAPPEPNAGSVTFNVLLSCKPRLLLYIGTFLLVPLIFLILLGCCLNLCICFKKTDRKKIKYILLRDNCDDKKIIQVPLLGSEEALISRRYDTNNFTKVPEIKASKNSPSSTEARSSDQTAPGYNPPTAATALGYTPPTAATAPGYTPPPAYFTRDTPPPFYTPPTMYSNKPTSAAK
ncbi:uncharacterized protein LOC106458323 [Limulus polyphemus]|uniref:Uncharacterized protein LOC106458323 n=1 Tax=Limulus polyphemus TaxID=6850 RepID=A0ABM1B272_LIMPO|nr:uncharacterized protein LOC106458323 [Limulus polyphemus]